MSGSYFGSHLLLTHSPAPTETCPHKNRKKSLAGEHRPGYLLSILLRGGGLVLCRGTPVSLSGKSLIKAAGCETAMR